MTTRMSCSIRSTVSPLRRAACRIEVGELERLLRVHARGRLVEQQQLRLRSRARAPPRAAAGRRRRGCARTARRAGEPAVGEQLDARARAPRASSRLTPRRPEDRRRSPPLRRECMPTRTFSSADICWKRRMFWNVRPMPRSVIACGGFAVDVLAVEDDASRGRLVDARDHVEERRLAGAVRADQADDRVPRDREVDVVDGDEAAELLAQRTRSGAGARPITPVTSWSGVSCTPVSNSSLRRCSGKRPCGRRSITSTMITP